MSYRSNPSAPGGSASLGYAPQASAQRHVGGAGPSIPGFPPLGAPTRGVSGSGPASFLGQTGRMGSFGMSAPNGLGHTPGAHSLNSQTDGSLDLSDFPALGAGGTQNPPSSMSLQASYASHANALATSVNGSGSALGSASDRTVAALLAGQRGEFTADDFPALDGSGASTDSAGREAREQASAAAALTAQMSRLSTMKSVSLSDAEKRNYTTRLGQAGENGPSPAGNMQFPSTQTFGIRSPAPPTNGSHPQSIPPLHSSQASGGMNYGSSARTPSSQSQSQQGSGDMDTSSTQPTPSLDHAVSVASAPQGIGSIVSGMGTLHADHLSSLHGQGAKGEGANGATAGMPQTPAEQVLFSPADRFGLLGLLHIIKNAESDMGKLMLGMDLTSLGLDLASVNALHPSLMTPWTETAQAAALNLEPEFHLPSCYHVAPPPVQHKLHNMHDESIFWIFYNQPRDVMQELAAAELYRRNWRYHKELQVWLTKEVGIEPLEKTSHYERGDYIFFDPKEWRKTKRDHTLVYDQLENKPTLANASAAQAATSLLPQVNSSQDTTSTSKFSTVVPIPNSISTTTTTMSNQRLPSTVTA